MWVQGELAPGGAAERTPTEPSLLQPPVPSSGLWPQRWHRPAVEQTQQDGGTGRVTRRGVFRTAAPAPGRDPGLTSSLAGRGGMDIHPQTPMAIVSMRILLEPTWVGTHCNRAFHGGRTHLGPQAARRGGHDETSEAVRVARGCPSPSALITWPPTVAQQ